jgi:hypothetical protein
MKTFVISECRLGNRWVKEFANTFNNHKEALNWSKSQVMEWLDAFHSTYTKGSEQYKSNSWSVYRKDILYYRYVIKTSLAKDEKELKESH